MNVSCVKCKAETKSPMTVYRYTRWTKTERIDYDVAKLCFECWCEWADRLMRVQSGASVA